MTSEERLSCIRRKTAELRRQKQGRRRAALSVSICLVLIAAAGAQMPEWLSRSAQSSVRHASGAASLVAGHAALGYILMGVLSFGLGVCATALAYRLRRRMENREDENDEF